jgi:D-alanyl-D-alanine carboxypeptidase/D-alanyl-D-alanine-endopeptidase (penicillin-binding protein 4)
MMAPGKRRLAAVGAALATLAVGATALGQGRAGGTASTLPAAIERIMSGAAYAHSSWGLMAADVATGQVVAEHMAAKMFVTGSILKVYAVASALATYGPDYRFETPVYRQGGLAEGVLAGNLVLVASGDLSFGLRERADGTLAFNSAPEVDHTYANTGLPGPALVPGGHPLAGVDDLAKQVRAAGIREVQGDVVIDDRLFQAYDGWPDGLIAPIWVNENVVDITTSPSTAGLAARVDWRPRTAAYRVESEVATVAGEGTSLDVDAPRPGVVRVRGQISVSSPPVLSIWRIEDPSAFARTAFIEALERAGVRVLAAPTGRNPAGLLPAARRYEASLRVATRVSPALAEYARVILKTSHNPGADLMVCLVAVRAGSRDCLDGLRREGEIVAGLGVSRASTMLFDGAGSDERDRTSAADMVRFLGSVVRQPWAPAFRGGLAVLGVDGDVATMLPGTAAAGKVRAKTGSRAAVGPGGLPGIATAVTMVGYVDTAAGRQLAFAILLRDLPFSGLDDFMAARNDLAAIAAALQQTY